MPADRDHLPVTVAPGRGEALDGYLERVATANHLSTASMLHLTRETGPIRFLMIRPTGRALTRLARLTGVPETRIAQASLDGLAGTALDLSGLDPDDRYSYRQVAARGWAAAHGSQVCPRCLADHGTWLLRWRTPYSMVCVEHGTYLLTHCPGCGRLFRDQHHSPLRTVGASTECGNPIGAGPRRHCRTKLTELTATRAFPDEIDVQRRIDTALDGRSITMLASDTPAGEYLQELRALTVLLLHLAGQPPEPDDLAWVAAVQHATVDRSRDRGPRWHLRPPDDPVARAGAFTTADAILAAPDVDAAGRKLTAWLDRVAPVPDGTLGWLTDRTHMTETLSQIVIAAHAPHRRLSHLLDQVDELLPSVFVPQVIPDAIYRRHLSGLFGSAPGTVRLFAAICLTRTTGSTVSWADAGQQLGLPSRLAEKTARACSARALVRPQRVIEALAAVAQDLPRLDRRVAENEVALLRRRRAWFDRFAATRPGTRSTSKGYAITWIWINVANGHLTTSPGWTAQPTRQERAHYRQFARSLASANQQHLRAVIRWE